jgi:hypothetical protein
MDKKGVDGRVIGGAKRRRSSNGYAGHDDGEIWRTLAPDAAQHIVMRR